MANQINFIIVNFCYYNVILILTGNILSIPCSGFIFKEENETSYELKCEDGTLKELTDTCRLLEYYNQSEVDLMSLNDTVNLSKKCACELYNMDELWMEAFDDPNTRDLSLKVERLLSRRIGVHPVYLWSDIDVTVYKVSIYTATKDFFEQQAKSRSKQAEKPAHERDALYSSIRSVCRKVARDPLKLYRYLENLNRLNSAVFFRLVSFTESILSIYQASKTCKYLLLTKLDQYKKFKEGVPPESDNIIEPNESDLQGLSEYSESLRSLKDSSVLLLKCERWQTRKSTLRGLARDCPMMLGERIPSEWRANHSTSIDRSLIAIKCGCQLLLHSAVWEKIIEDTNIQIMSEALTNFLSQNSMPDVVHTPVWSLYDWFNRTMAEFVNNKNLSVREIIKTTKGEDPLEVIGARERADALELLRRGCNFIMFNYQKGTKDAIELKLIKYLDNLQTISQDPLFVFHLTLQDLNLFKLHALSKWCEPIVK